MIKKKYINQYISSSKNIGETNKSNFIKKGKQKSIQELYFQLTKL